eukprot:TRINITY_DN5253_c0_g2_i2.p1 TRINITY_DN5253_c0_g2~~TRINITY_DN5253_c0_g2_i2.p1  ORF type:complete len:145 (+),score=23.02 TRINITY_DN5253_c0_g2_i2:61-495(+)
MIRQIVKAIIVGILSIALFRLLSVLTGDTHQQNDKTHFNTTKTRYWGAGSPTVVNEEIVEFKVDIKQEVIDDLLNRIDNTRYFEPIYGDYNWTYGTVPEFTKDLLGHWKGMLSNWPAHQDILNRYPQFITEIDGIKIHFFACKS